MKFTVKTDDEIVQEERDRAAQFLYPDGEYDFEIEDAADEVSAKGNEMIKLEVRLFKHDGSKGQKVFDYILEAFPKKLKHAAEACGLVDQYNSGTLEAADFLGQTGKVSIKTQLGKNGYRDKNIIDDYIVPTERAASAKRRTPPKKAAPASIASDFDDEIPF